MYAPAERSGPACTPFRTLSMCITHCAGAPEAVASFALPEKGLRLVDRAEDGVNQVLAASGFAFRGR